METGWEARMASRSRSGELLARTLARLEDEVAEAATALEQLRQHGKGPIGDPGCCKEWQWKNHPTLGGPYDWWAVPTCGVYNGEWETSTGCDHPHHRTDGTWVAFA